MVSCEHSSTDVPAEDRDFKQDMRDFVIGISQYAKAANPDFAIIPQNGIALVTVDGEISGAPATAYLDAIDGNGQEDLFYGYDNDDHETPIPVTSDLVHFLDISKNQGNTILTIDYCSTHNKMDNSYAFNFARGYVSFAASDRSLATIPNYPANPFNENNNVIALLSQAKNHLFFINAENYPTKSAYINAVTATNYDILITDLFFNDGTAFTADEVEALRNKANGGKRLVICYMSIGEAEDYRYYWNSSWSTSKPAWLDAENPDWAGNYKVKYWNPEWQSIIYGNNNSYLSKILAAGYDGVYLDIIDAFEYYE